MNLLTGLNGGGKSSVLLAIVAAALGERMEDAQFDASGWLRRGAKRDGHLRLGLVAHPSDDARGDLLYGEREPVRPLRLEAVLPRAKRGARCSARAKSLAPGTSDRDAARALREDAGPAWFLVAYGPTRHAAPLETERDAAERSPRHSARLQRVASLLDERARLVPLEAWLPELARRDPERHAEVKELLAALLPPTTRFLDEREGAAYLFEQDGVAVPHGALSEGLRSHVAWIADLLHHLAQAAPQGLPLDQLPGVVLVDEVEQRLHPRWQLALLG